MIPTGPRLSLSTEDRARVEAIERRGIGSDAVTATHDLLPHLADPSWAVRRAAVAALARLGDVAVPALCEQLRRRDENESRLAAVVDALVASRGDVETPLLELAGQDVDAAILCDAAQILGRRNTARATPVLAHLANHADDNVAVGAIEALGRIEGPAAIEALAVAASSDNFFRVFPAIEALGRAGDPRAIARIAPRLDEPLYAVVATRALGRAGDIDVVAPLARLLGGTGETLVRAAAQALVEIDTRYRAKFGVDDAVARATHGAVRPETAARQLARCIAGAEPGEQAALCRVLTWVDGASAAGSLIDLLDAEPTVARAAIDALTALGADAEPQMLLALRENDSARRRALLPLVRGRGGAARDVVACLSDTDPSVRALAAHALGRIGDPSVVGALFDHLGEIDARVSQAVIGAIQSLGSAETEARTLQAMGASEPAVRRAALRIAAYLGYARGLDALVVAMSDPDERVRDAAIYGLPLLDDPRALDALMAAAVHPAGRTRAAAMRALGQTEPAPATLDRLRQGLRDPEAWVRYFACQSIGRLRDLGSTDALAERLDDEAGQVRIAALEALAHLGGERAHAALCTVATSPDPDIRRAALVGIGIAKPPAAVPILLDAATGADGATRVIALSALAGFDAPEVLPTLRGAMTDPDESVRDAVIGLLAARPGTAATEALVALLANPAIRTQVIEALATPTVGRIPGILAALETADDAFTMPLAAALARVRRPVAIAALSVALAFEHPPARRAAASVLAALDTPEATAALARTAADDPDPEVRRLVARATKR